jgi:hypothetical protein
MRKLALAAVAAATMLATVPVMTAQAEPIGRGQFENVDQFSARHRDHGWRHHYRHESWRRGHHFGSHGYPWWLKRRHFDHDYGWYRGPSYRW